MGDDITIGVTEIVNNIEVTAQPNDQIVEIDVVDNSDEVTLNITPTVIEININKGSSFARWGDILGNLPDQEDLQNVLNLKADLVGGLVPASQLPSYVDDIIEVANYAALPTTGEVDKIYITLDTNKVYRWGGSSYVEIASNSAVWGGITGTLSSQTDLQTALDTKALKTITITTNSPLTGGGDLSANRTISIPQADSVTNGYISGADWTRFDNKQPALIGVGFVKISGTTISYDNSTYVPTSRTITINGTGYDLSDNRTFNVGTVTSVAALTLGTTGTNINSTVANGTTTPVITLNIPTASATNRGALSSTDWSTFNSKEPAISSGTNLQYLRGDKTWQLLTTDAVSEGGNLYFTDSRARSAVTGFSGSINYLSKFTSNATIGSSIIYDDGTQIGIGTNVPQRKLSVRDINNTYSATFSGSAGLNMVAIGTVSGATNGVPSIGAFTNSFAATTNLAINPTGGNVGIGTTSPSNLLSVGVANSTTGKGITIENTSGSVYGRFGVINPTVDNDTYIGSMSNNNFLIYSNATERMRIAAGGNVGIGTTSPNQKLSVIALNSTPTLAGNQGTFSVLQGAADYGIVMGTKSSGNGWVQVKRVDGTATAYDLELQPLGGNVGIGTTSPNLKLTVLGANGAPASSGTTQNGVLRLTAGTGLYNVLDFGINETNDYSWIQSTRANNLAVYDKLALQPQGGNVGIGTTSPAAKLSISYSSATADALNIVNTNTNGRSWYVGDGAGLGAGNFGFYDATAGSSRMVISSGGNVGIGTTSPAGKLSVNGDLFLTTTGRAIVFNSDANYATQMYESSGNLAFQTGSSERMRITSGGDVFIGKSAIDYTVTGVQIENGGKAFGITTNTSTSTMFLNRRNSLTGSFIGFYYNDGLVGSISTNGSATAYNTTSDYRLKEDLKEIKGLEKISKIKVYDFKWKDDNSRMDGVIAHELQEIVPYAVSGEKDAEKMQQVDYSKLVPILVQAIQELKSEIEILKTK
jgi:hypothetical protein